MADIWTITRNIFIFCLVRNEIHASLDLLFAKCGCVTLLMFSMPKSGSRKRKRLVLWECFCFFFSSMVAFVKLSRVHGEWKWKKFKWRLRAQKVNVHSWRIFTIFWLRVRWTFLFLGAKIFLLIVACFLFYFSFIEMNAILVHHLVVSSLPTRWNPFIIIFILQSQSWHHKSQRLQH